ncbi:hypothetical protein LCGC14_0897160 [marine sediment metagenome]|uniref:Uncharacterized protein n=1 Tax=marine sediment metagenome TaxID=412755 RepID=A0A0F9S4B7_9ZZZZ|nr:hypothetical protein [Methylophaga sp.]
MQINSGQFASVFPQKLLEPQDNARKPVTIDVKANVEFDGISTADSSTKIAAFRTSDAAIRVNEQQQAQFIRFFSINESSSSLINTDKQTPSQTNLVQLPKGVQQYLQVAATDLQIKQNLLDETV